MFMRVYAIVLCSVTGICVLSFGSSGRSDEPSVPLKAGIIGLDGHAAPWTKIINNPKATGELAEMTVVAGYPGGSPDIPKSMNVLPKYTEIVREQGVEIVDSIDELLEKVDVVMVLSRDGRPHLEQAKKVIAAGKPLFIDKPVAASLEDAVKIYRLAAEKNVPCFSSSSLRFNQKVTQILNDAKLGRVTGCATYSPNKFLEPSHPDLFYYGIHGVETLFTIMGPGCRSVTRVHTEGTELVVGVWEDGRVGTFRGIRSGCGGFGATVFGTKGIETVDHLEGYEPLLIEIVKFFKTGKPPVSTEETLEIYAFMEAADECRRRGNGPVLVNNVLEKVRRDPF